MKKAVYFLFLLLFGFCVYSPAQKTKLDVKQPQKVVILKIQMSLDAVGVESDGFPYIDATLNFKRNSSVCKVSYDNPKFKNSTYSLTLTEMKRVLYLIQNVDLDTLKKEYKIGMTDQPTSTTIIYTSRGDFKITDYALQAEYPLTELYEIVYKLKRNFR